MWIRIKAAWKEGRSSPKWTMYIPKLYKTSVSRYVQWHLTSWRWQTNGRTSWPRWACNERWRRRPGSWVTSGWPSAGPRWGRTVARWTKLASYSASAWSAGWRTWSLLQGGVVQNNKSAHNRRVCDFWFLTVTWADLIRGRLAEVVMGGHHIVLVTVGGAVACENSQGPPLLTTDTQVSSSSLYTGNYYISKYLTT